MNNIKPESKKKTTSKNIDEKKTKKNESIAFQNYINQEFIEKHFLEKTDGYTIQEVIEEYRNVNDGFVKVMNKLITIFDTMKVNKEDITYLNSIEYYYYKREIIRKDARFFNEDLFKNILEATLSDTIDKAKEFFGDSIDLWEDAVSKYRSLSFKISDQYYRVLIKTVDKLLSNLTDLHNDFFNEKNEFKDWFNFSDILKEAQTDYPDLIERKKFINSVIVDCKEFCLKQEYFKVREEDKQEFMQKCQELIELIDFQIKNDIPSNPFNLYDVNTNISSEQEVITPKNSLPETDITLNRQFLALYYLLNEVDKDVFARNKSEIARFIQLLTGKSYDNIYKLTKNPVKDPAERTSKKYQSDIQFVKESFLKLGLNKIAQQIENDNLVG